MNSAVMPLQKSFSETNHSKNKPKGQWSRSKTYNGPRLGADKPLEELKPVVKASVAISSATKNKLKGFQFDERKNKSADVQTGMTTGAESNPVDLDDKLQDSPVTKLASRVQQLSQNELPKITKPVPATPSSDRLRLPDLFAMADIDSPAQRLVRTPEDGGVSWNHEASAFSSSGISSVEPRSRRGIKRRAKSSSPGSSPARNTNHYDVVNPDGDSATKSGPGLNLYTGTAETPAGLNNPLLAFLANTNSPQQHSRRTTLQRSVSYGDQVSKKRRLGTDRSFGGFADVAAKPTVVKHPKVGALLEGILERKAALAGSDISGPSSSSPARMRHMQDADDVSMASSPLKRTVMGPPPPRSVTVSRSPSKSPSKMDSERKTIDLAVSTESDYGDDEYDDEIMNMAAEQVLSTQRGGAAQPTSSPTARKGPGPKLPQSYVKPPEPPGTTKKAPAQIPTPVAKPVTTVSFDDDDDFAGMFSDDDFEGAEITPLPITSSKPRTESFGPNASFSAPPVAASSKPPPVKAATIPPSKPAAKPAPKPSAKPAPKPVVDDGDETDYDAFFDDSDDGALGADIVVLPQTKPVPAANSSYPPPSGSQKARVIQRYLVTSIIDNQYLNDKGRQYPEKILKVQVETTKELKTIHLRGGWIETPVTEKAYVHVIGTFVHDKVIIDDEQNMIILHPDHLLSSTVVADSFSCTRRAVLQDRVKATSDSSAPLVYGTILHEIFQSSMIANRWDTSWLHELIDKMCAQHVEDLYVIQVHIPQAVEHLRSKMNELQSWAKVFVSAAPKPGAVVKAGNGDTAQMAITKLLDVEEHVWSPMYGLKGNIDATVQVTMQDPKTRAQRRLTVPFEVKTGKSVNASHRAQTALYNLLLSDRYDIEIVYGVLYYMETSETVRIPRIRHELRHLIMQRNSLAVYVRDKSTTLPPMLKKEPLCSRCYAKTTCFIYHKLAEDGDGETSGMKAKFDEVVKHLSPKHKEFFMKWDDLLTKEERESMKFRRELWTMLSAQREKFGRCFSNVVIEPNSAYEEVGGGKINRFKYTLIRDPSEGGKTFLDSQIVVGEPIVISDEKGHFALANGFVTNISKRRVTVAVDRRLHNSRVRKPGFDEVNNQTFSSIMDVANPTSSFAVHGTQTEPQVKYRLDKDEFSNGLASVRNNLISVMSSGTFGSAEIRSLVVDLKAPRFREKPTQYVLKDRESINLDQRRAIQKVMSAQDYALVLGMPGTGKTTTIAHIIRALVAQGKSVLLTSYTHSAVDTILLKLKDDKIPILRLGQPSKVHPEVQTFVQLAAKPRESFEEIRSLWHDTPIVATTCLGTTHALFSQRTFDYCIVDEASQITLPVCLGPIRLARAFVLVGDHNQLPPLVANEDARTGGLDISLFKLLNDAHSQAVVELGTQYRMCAEVMELSNQLIYSGRLKCGTEAVASRRLVIPNIAGLSSCHAPLGSAKKEFCPVPAKGTCWLADLLDPDAKACFVDTDSLLPMAREEAKGNRIVNPTESAIVTQLVSGLLSVGVPGAEIGVMTHYRSQLALLKASLAKSTLQGANEVEMHTCDRFQGRDKEVVIISLVRSNEGGSIGELLKDWRRINVAFTRAKSKLLVVGSGSTLKGQSGESQEMLGKFVRLMEGKGWCYELPRNALDGHVWEDGATQMSGLPAESPQMERWKRIERGRVSVTRSYEADESGNKENLAVKGRREPKRKGVSERVLLDGKQVLRDIMNNAIG